MKEIFLDFDGTIVDVWKRYYTIFCDFYDLNLDFEFYKKEKKRLQRDFYLAKKYANIHEFSSYNEYKNNRLEDLDYLKLDTVILEKKDVRKYKILTYRNNKVNLLLQMQYLGLVVCIDNIVVLNPKNLTKCNYLSSHFDAVVVGDSESEYDCAQNKNSSVFLVNTGLRDVEGFKPKSNVKIIENINQLICKLESKKTNNEK